MEIRPNIKVLYYRFFSGLLIGLFAGLIPGMVYVFILALLGKFGWQNTVSESQTLLMVYFFSSFVIYIFSLLERYFYIKKSYISMDNNGIEVYKSFISQTKKTVPYINLQSFEVNQGLLERLVGLATIYIYTKGMDEDYALSGFEYKYASEFVENATKEYGIKTK